MAPARPRAVPGEAQAGAAVEEACVVEVMQTAELTHWTVMAVPAAAGSAVAPTRKTAMAVPAATMLFVVFVVLK